MMHPTRSLECRFSAPLLQQLAGEGPHLDMVGDKRSQGLVAAAVAVEPEEARVFENLNSMACTMS